MEKSKRASKKGNKRLKSGTKEVKKESKSSKSNDNDSTYPEIAKAVIKSVFEDVSGHAQENALLSWLIDDIHGTSSHDVNITRYALALFYYSTGGDDWNNNE